MTTEAERILFEFDLLEPHEKMLVRDHVIAVTQRERQNAIMRLRGSAKGEHLLKKLMKDRSEERSRG